MIGKKGRSAYGLLVVAAMALLASGCATLAASVEPPAVRLAGVKLVEAGFSRQSYVLTLAVTNPNGFSLPVRGVAYRVRLAGETFAEGDSPRSFDIPANGESSFDLTVNTDLMRSISSLRGLLEQREKTISYELDGELRVNLPFAGGIPFSRSGEVDLVGDLTY